MNPQERLARGYAASPLDAKRNESIAATFTPDAQMESLIQTRRDKPEIYNLMGPAMRISLGFYEQAKAAAQRTEDARLLADTQLAILSDRKRRDREGYARLEIDAETRARVEAYDRAKESQSK
jgi:hypothetical protein